MMGTYCIQAPSFRLAGPRGFARVKNYLYTTASPGRRKFRTCNTAEVLRDYCNIFKYLLDPAGFTLFTINRQLKSRRRYIRVSSGSSCPYMHTGLYYFYLLTFITVYGTIRYVSSRIIGWFSYIINYHTFNMKYLLCIKSTLVYWGKGYSRAISNTNIYVLKFLGREFSGIISNQLSSVKISQQNLHFYKCNDR